MNVASADQRLLVLVDANEEVRESLDATLSQVFAAPEVIGKFHLAFAESANEDKGKEDWKTNIKGETTEKGVYIIRSGQFGLDGVVMQRLETTSDAETIQAALLESNETFASDEERKVYKDHVRAGRRKRIYFENEIPYGEDRDGDGKIDNARGGRSRR